MYEYKTFSNEVRKKLPWLSLTISFRSELGQVQVQQVQVQILDTLKIYFGLYWNTFYWSTFVLSTCTEYECTQVQ